MLSHLCWKMLWWTGKLGKNDWFSQELALKTCRLFSAGLYNSVFALHHRDLVHRQTASAVVQHMSLGVYGFGCEDSLNHLLNYVWPNVFETSPHVIQAVMGALEGLRVAIGPCRMLQYCLQVHFYFSSIESPHFAKRFSLTCKDLKAQYFFSLNRVCSILLAKCVMCTGRSTTPSTSAPRMH